MTVTKTRGVLASAVFVLFLAPAALAEDATGEVVSVNGDLVTVRIDDGTTREFVLSPTLRIVTPSSHEMRATDLQTGQMIRITAKEAATPTERPLAQSIVLVTPGQTPSSQSDVDPHGVPIEKGRDVEVERDEDGGFEIDYDD